MYALVKHLDWAPFGGGGGCCCLYTTSLPVICRRSRRVAADSGSAVTVTAVLSRVKLFGGDVVRGPGCQPQDPGGILHRE